jgi:hypothetical protein
MMYGAIAQEKQGQIDQAWAALKNDDCRSAWDILWPLAKSGNVEARYYLYSAVASKIIPPGVTKDPPSWYRHVLALSAYAALRPRERYASDTESDGRFARVDVPASIKALNLGEGGEKVAKCYKGASSLQTCLDLGISLGIIPTFEDYARETELTARETGIPARCLPHH